MPMVHGLSGSTSPMASTSTNTHHDQMTAHYHQYTAYDAAREAGPSSSAVASSSRLTIPQPQHSHPRQLYNTNGRDWPSEHQSSSATPTASSSIAMPSATSSPHYSNSDRSLSNAAVTSESSLSQQTPSTTPSSSLALPPSNMPTTAASLMREGPRDFTVIKDVGDGSFGTVCLADWKSPLPSGTLLSPMQHPTTRPEYLGKRLVAIKKMKKPFPNWEECIKLKELKCLLAIPHHPNIIPLYDAFLMPTSKELHFVFECMEGNLYQLTKSRRGRPLAAGLVASIFQQIVKGLHHIHQEGYFHRDMKPENLLITTTGLADYPSSPAPSIASPAIEKDVLVIVKLADFGLARETNSKPPYTEYVSTRWYRAPEVLLRSRDYSNPVDMWALGTILAELVNLKPLFPGQSEVDQVLQICEILGDPSGEYGRDEQGRQRGGGNWTRGIKMASNVGFSFPKVEPVAFSALFSSKVPNSLVECIQDLLRYEPNARLTTQDCLNHPYFTKVAPRLHPPQARAVIAATTPEEQAALSKTNAKATVMNSFGSVMDQRAQRSALPPSHSMVPQSSKPGFGESKTSPMENDADVAMEGASSHGEERSAAVSDMTRWAPAPLPARQSSFSQYPAFPDSTSVYTPSQASTYFDKSGAPSFAPSLAPSEANRLDAQYYAAAQRRAHDNDLEMKNSEYNRRGVPQQQQHSGYPSLNYDHANPVYRHGRPENNSFLAESSNSGETESPSGLPESSAKEGERRKSKGWISSVLGGNTSSTGQSRQPSDQGQQQQGLSPTGVAVNSTPAQLLAAQHSERVVQPPVDAKKAKKLAEKAAREAEKAKRAAQEQAARERARAVMQKRNQILADSNSRDQVEWLTLADSDMTKALQPPGSLHASFSPLPSEVSRGKQASMMQASASDQSGHQSNVGPIPPYVSSSNFVNNPVWQSQRSSPRGKVRRREVDEEGVAPPHRSYFAGAHLAREDPRRQSIQSFQTGDSDPGPNRSLVPGSGMHFMQHHESSTSLNSAPGLIDGTSSSRTRFGDRNSFDTRSVASSLDNQLIQNMENMTAAESGPGGGVRQRGGSMSPGPVHLIGPRPSYSRQSHGSRASSAHRQGSASPLHHQAPPRFHPYSVGPNAINGSVNQQPTSAHSSYNFNLPSLASITTPDYVESMHIGSARPKSLPRRSSQSANRGPASRGSSMASTEGFGPRQHGPINPMFHVAKSSTQPPLPSGHLFDANGTGLTSPGLQQPVLPPFSHIAAAASSSHRDDGDDSNFSTLASSPRHRSHSTSQQ